MCIVHIEKYMHTQNPAIKDLSNPHDVTVLTDHPSKHLISSADLDIGIISLGVNNLKTLMKSHNLGLNDFKHFDWTTSSHPCHPNPITRQVLIS